MAAEVHTYLVDVQPLRTRILSISKPNVGAYRETKVNKKLKTAKRWVEQSLTWPSNSERLKFDTPTPPARDEPSPNKSIHWTRSPIRMSVSKAPLSRMQLTLHAIHPRNVRRFSAWCRQCLPGR